MESNGKIKVRRAAKRVMDLRVKLITEERLLTQAIADLTRPRGSLKELSAELGVSAAYICDVTHGRRGFGGLTVEKLMELS
jgi:hypothetical protein